MKKIIALCLVFVALCTGLAFKSRKNADTIVIYTSTEDYNMELLEKRLNEVFPKYDIVVEYVSTSNIASKIIEEGSSSECDIIFQQDYGYLDMMVEKGVLADISNEYNTSLFMEDMLGENKNYIVPTTRNGGAVIINKNVLKEKGIKKPTSYNDLLKPEFNGLVTMPNPKTSSTGYMFYLSLVNAWGEEAALKYFDGFKKNATIRFTTSGSGPVNKLKEGEVAVGFGMTAQAVEIINGGHDELEVVFFNEGSPVSFLGTSVVKGKETNIEVMEVLDYIINSYIEESCEKFYPEKVFKNIQFEKANFPKNVKYSKNKKENGSIKRKEQLLKNWKY